MTPRSDSAKPSTTTRKPTTINIIFSPACLAENLPPTGEPVAVVRYARRNHEVADAAALLTDAGIPFEITWVQDGGRLDHDPAALKHAEENLARALAVSLTQGTARRAKVYADEIETLDLAD